MAFKFEKLEVWQDALDYADRIYAIAEALPKSEAYNLTSQMTRAVTSIALNVAEGSTGQSDQEQARFLGYAIRSLIETVACLRLIERRDYLADPAPLREAYRYAERLARRLQAFRSRLVNTDLKQVREDSVLYDPDAQAPF